MEIMTIYDRYAEVYDRSGQIAFSLKMIPYLDALLARHSFTGHTVLDLACGTGTVALAFARRGLKVYGVDASEKMLAQAQSKVRDTGLHVILSQQDMRSFTLPQPVDLVTCLYDSLNYLLTLDDLLAAFGRVSATMLPGGLFLFDMNTEHTLREVWDNNVFYVNDDDLSIILRSTYDEATRESHVQVIGFIKVGEKYERFEEWHTEVAYSEAEVEWTLREQGLEAEAKYECFTFDPPLGEASKRIMWVARKR